MNAAPNYLSSRFKKETNIRFMSFVTIAKVDEAKKLLKMTNKSLSEISNYLSFSSQSYFQNVFKKSIGITPLEYRDKNQVKGEEK
jgi:YesN/AraC family two-component response regulator